MISPESPHADLLAAAARNNALWCRALCRTHHRPGEFVPGAWVSGRRTPPFYPDAVTIAPDAAAEAVVAAVDAGPGCTVKDSFARLDLAPHGFVPLFDAEWIHRPSSVPLPPGAPDSAWRRVGSGEELAAWERAAGLDGLFRPALLADPAVRVLAAPGLAAGAVLNRTDDGVGVSNVFPDESADTWAALVLAADAEFPGLPLLGYEHGPALEAARAAGFEAVGPLRVWLRPGPNE